jgi:ATP-dependent DNA helicase DinG
MGGQIEPFQHRIGAEQQRVIIEDSPFDYQRHMRVYVAADIPQPTPSNRASPSRSSPTTSAGAR